MSFFVLIICFVNIFGLNIITFNPDNTTPNTTYVCPNNDDCQIICKGNEVCKDKTFICPNNYNCDITCTPDKIGEGTTNRNACQNSIIIATYSNALNIECRNYGCNGMIINMTYGNELDIFEPYLGYEGIYQETNAMTGISMYNNISVYMYDICICTVIYSCVYVHIL